MVLLVLMVQRCKQGPPLSIVPLHPVLFQSVIGSNQTQPEAYYHRVMQSRSSVDRSILVKQGGS